ncbi:hypothetical protein [Oceanospirillum sediminis]|uniref:Uncharacterized protein n=1 Tax=Oceanospirillum sediminis TaxID=2760088 RepID=A0A839ILH8_9GAMM|nr:hypothetical protein [Oceanospirillum sediminis]MBB1485550.1 hypothetical protein [Oceanospirillum sediminis]
MTYESLRVKAKEVKPPDERSQDKNRRVKNDTGIEKRKGRVQIKLRLQC